MDTAEFYFTNPAWNHSMPANYVSVTFTHDLIDAGRAGYTCKALAGLLRALVSAGPLEAGTWKPTPRSTPRDWSRPAGLSRAGLEETFYIGSPICQRRSGGRFKVNVMLSRMSFRYFTRWKTVEP